jgi:hypothetical protein
VYPGSVTFWSGSGSPDSYLLLMDPALFVSDLQDANKKVMKVDLHHSSNEVKKKSQNSRNQRFFFFFLLVDGRIRILTNKFGGSKTSGSGTLEIE